jgi:hypothetical protein
MVEIVQLAATDQVPELVVDEPWLMPAIVAEALHNASSPNPGRA